MTASDSKTGLVRKLLVGLTIFTSFYGCKTTRSTEGAVQPIIASLDLVNVQDDKVQVMIDPGRFTTSSTTFYIPKTVPGTYSEDNYGRFIENFRALDYDGKELEFVQVNENSWRVDNAANLDRVSYWVNDTYDMPGEGGVFSPSGTNIEKGRNFMLNLHGFVGYFEGLQEQQYRLQVTRPETLIPGTALNAQTVNSRSGEPRTDIFLLNRYFEVTDNPIMYARPDTTSFAVQGMKVLIDVYSPSRVYSAESIKPGVQQMITAQKNFLGEIDNTGKYAILLYLSQPEQQDASGMGALEHHTSTVVVLPENMPATALQQTMTDVVSHEFFHILTPLNIHSKEIHYFDYNDPEMSKHLWMYEGVTEYFANFFQVNQGLIDEQSFYNRMVEKLETSRNFDDTVPFTVMSENILEEEYKDMYYNVYLKGALIGMTLDIRLRELSGGEMGLLDLMKRLSAKYGMNNPFDDDQLFDDIEALTFPEIRQFLETYVSGPNPIPYGEFLDKVGLEIKEEQIITSYFLKDQVPYVDINPETGQLFFRENIGFNTFLEELGAEGGDIILSINGTPIDQNTAYAAIMESMSWDPGKEVTIVVERDGEEKTLTAVTFQPTDTSLTIVEQDLPANHPKVQLREAWLKE